LLVLTKADLAGELDAIRDQVAVDQPWLDVLTTSSTTGQGIDELRHAWPGRRTTVHQAGAALRPLRASPQALIIFLDGNISSP